MRNLFLIRHGQAFDKAQDDGQRHLTAQGRSEVIKTAQFLQKTSFKINEIITSRKIRAIETGRILSESLIPKPPLKEADGLLPNDSPGVFLSVVEDSADNKLIVGHLPFLLNFSRLLLGLDDGTFNLKFSTAAIVGFEKDSQGQWQLMFCLAPEVL